MNQTVNIHVYGWSSVTPVKESFDAPAQGVVAHWMRTTALMAAMRGS